jgi:hypothetical protein
MSVFTGNSLLSFSSRGNGGTANNQQKHRQNQQQQQKSQSALPLPGKAVDPIIPTGKTVDERLKSMQQNPLYADQNDRRLFNHVTREYQRAYPGEAQYDEFGKMKRPRPSIQPGQVRAFDPNGVAGLMNKGKAQAHRLQQGQPMMPPQQSNAGQNAAAARAQAAIGQDAQSNAEDLHGVDLHAMGVETMDDIVAGSMTREEAALKQAQENHATAQRQANNLEDVLEDADDMAGFDVEQTVEQAPEDYIAQTKATPKIKADYEVWNKRRDAIQGGFDSGKPDDFKDTADYIRANMNDPKFLRMIKPQSLAMFEEYEEAKQAGLSETEAQDAAYERGANYYMTDAASSSVSDTWHKAGAGIDAMLGRQIDVQELNRRFANDRADVPERYQRTKTFQNTKGVVNFATDAVGTVIKPVGALTAAGDIAYEVAKHGGSAADQRNAAFAGAAVGALGGGAARLVAKGAITGGIKAAGKTALGKNATVQAAVKTSSKTVRKYTNKPGAKLALKAGRIAAETETGRQVNKGVKAGAGRIINRNR